MITTAYAIFITIGWVATSVYLLMNSRTISYLKNVPVAIHMEEPTVAIIIAVKDEEKELETALTSVCNLDYPNLSIVVVNDRSTDRTPEIIREMSARYPELSLITINELPKGWLGKNHALYQGYLVSTAEWLLFTDADILYQADTLKKAMQYVAANRLDHLTALPEITSQSSLFKAVMNTFTLMLEIKLRPWNVRDAASSASIGVGAFNLVRRSAYEKTGTHAIISLRPDDDLKLGELVKKAGFRQDVVYGDKEISLQWYSNLSEFVNGLMKNTFSISNYSLPIALAMAVVTIAVFVLPFPVLMTQGQTGLVMILAVLSAQIGLMLGKKGMHGKWWHSLVIPFAGCIMAYILVKSAIKTLRQGGIYWRDSFYPLEELRKQR